MSAVMCVSKAIVCVVVQTAVSEVGGRVVLDDVCAVHTGGAAWERL